MCLACPTLTGLIDPSGSRRGNLLFCVLGLLSVLVYWVDWILVVCRRTKKIRSLLCPRFTSAYRRCSPADCGAPVFFLHVLLNAGELAGHRRSIPRKIMPPVCSPSALIPSAISSLGCHASLVSPPGLPGSLLPYLDCPAAESRGGWRGSVSD